jgi:hypothetical protein
MDPQRRYLSYLLRLWQESSGDPPLWRASLESPQTGERRGFASLAELFTFLETEVRQVVQDRPVPSTPGEGGDIDRQHPNGISGIQDA